MSIIIIMYLLLLIGIPVFIHYRRKYSADAPLSVGLKAACTLIAVTAALLLTAETSDGGRLTAALICGGLVFGLVGDITICQPSDGGFLSGMLFFGIGHLSYIAAFAMITSAPLWAIPIFAVIFVPTALIMCRLSSKNDDIKKMLFPILGYAAVIITMLAFSASAAISVKYGFVLLTGGALFTISDSLLALGTFGGSPSPDSAKSAGFAARIDTLCLYSYFIAQSCFVLGIYLML